MLNANKLERERNKQRQSQWETQMEKVREVQTVGLIFSMYVNENEMACAVCAA